MQIPETPQNVIELDLMRRLDEYANGTATWTKDGVMPGLKAQQACRTLHTNLTNLVNSMFAFILDRVTAREMEAFTMHDRVHGRKVAHLMWHILKPERRLHLTPPEIGMLVVAAHLHDLGMGLSRSERDERLKPESDLWDRLEIQDNVRNAIEKLRQQIGDENTSDSAKRRAEQQLFQAEEALLTQDTRERHATRERYQEILGLLSEFHQKDPVRIPDIEAALAFDGDSFRDKLIDVCMSHNEDADALVANDEKNLDRPRFPVDFPVGICTADLHLVAAALRLADILDFDRERTPAVLFHYLLPTTLGSLENRSVLEWSKHLAISNWHIERDDIIFRGRSTSHIIHHAVVQFCVTIAEELKATHATFSPLGEEYWPFALPLSAKTDIHEDGYRYVPYKFELDDDRVYSLLMGGAIYDNPLVAVRELVQNAVDACKLRDSLTQLYEEYDEPSKVNRIFIRYEEPSDECPYPKLRVRDTGTGMDAYTLERYFLRVGRSYYNSSDFNQFRVQLRKKNLDFAPVSEFGIGFLSSFLLADHVEVETAMWESLRGDTAKRILKIDGPTRLIRLDEQRNEGAGRFKGTQITLFVSSKIVRNGQEALPSWEVIKEYLVDTCQDLPYRLNLQYVKDRTEIKESIDPLPLTVNVPPHLENAALRIPVNDKELGMEGEIVLINPLMGDQVTDALTGKAELILVNRETQSVMEMRSTLLRGGFNIGSVDGLPSAGIHRRFAYGNTAAAKIRLTWGTRQDRRYLTPRVARDRLSDSDRITERVFQIWLRYLLHNVEKLPTGQVLDFQYEIGRLGFDWLEEFSALTVYQLGKQDWILRLARMGTTEPAFDLWESGKGPVIWYDHSGLSRDLLNLILPRVTNLELRADGTHISPPRENWRSTLENCRDFVQRRLPWGLFCKYDGAIEDFLFYRRGPALNIAYEERFVSWSREDLQQLRRLLLTILDRYIAVPKLTPSATHLFRRLIEEAGELKVGTLQQHFVLKNMKVTEIE